MSSIIYNEFEPYAVEWLRNLSRDGHIAEGLVLPDSITDLKPEEIEHATQAHFFAGIGVWSYALRLAGWPEDEPVWTGSCPCQPFSKAAGARRKGFDDVRHLWPTWFELIKACGPPTVFGEQVASEAGREWFGLVSANLESLGYEVGAADLCAAGVGAPHIRQRLFFVAHSPEKRQRQQELLGRGKELGQASLAKNVRAQSLGHDGAGGKGALSGNSARRKAAFQKAGFQRSAGGLFPANKRGVNASPWEIADWVECRDGKVRPTEPGILPVADGTPNRVGRLSAYGNAIVPQVAAAFIEAVMPWVGVG